MEIWNNVKKEGGDWDSNPGLRDTSRCIKKKRKSTTGLEPAISRFVGGRLIHWATRTHLTVIYVHTPIHTLIPSSHSTYTLIITDKGLVQHPHPALLCRPQSFDKPNIIMLQSALEKRLPPTDRLHTCSSVLHYILRQDNVDPAHCIHHTLSNLSLTQYSISRTNQMTTRSTHSSKARILQLSTPFQDT